MFDNYKAFDGHSKKIEPGRYLVGLFTARVFDLKARKVKSNNKKGGVGVPFRGGIMREVSYGSDEAKLSGEFQLAIDDPTRAVLHHCFSLHPFVLIVAANHALSIFGDGVLAQLGVNIQEQGPSYDRYIEYRPLSSKSESNSIINALRVGKAHSEQCDGDHRMGRDMRYLHGLLYCALTSHRMNTCFGHSRKNAGHWCAGAHIMKYNGGVESSPEFDIIDSIDSMTFPTGEEVRNGVVFVGSNLE